MEKAARKPPIGDTLLDGSKDAEQFKTLTGPQRRKIARVRLRAQRKHDGRAAIASIRKQRGTQPSARELFALYQTVAAGLPEKVEA